MRTTTLRTMNDITITLKGKRYSALHPCSRHTPFLRGTTWRSVIHYFYGEQLCHDSLTAIRDDLTKDGPFDELKAPLLPPWLKFPDIPPHSIGWRMGAGEGYLCEFSPWYRGLTAEGRRKYKEMYPPPKGWG